VAQYPPLLRRLLLAGTALVLLAGGQAPSAQQDAGASLADRFLARADVPLERYEARRSMHAQNTRFHKEAWLEADTRLDPDSGFTYTVVSSRGSSLVINRVLLPALRGEAEMWATHEPASYGLTRENYEFRDMPDMTADEARVSITPKRKHLLLVAGALVLSPLDGDLLRVEGRVSKNPSFWVSRVDVVRRYGRIDGVRVPLALESVAHVRIAGASEMTTTYHYTSINGEPVLSEPIPLAPRVE
jgi:hypothetical protein